MQLLNVTAVASATNLRPHNIYNLAKRGMPHYRTGARVRFSLPEVLAWMRQQADEQIRCRPSKDSSTDGFEPVGSIIPKALQLIDDAARSQERG